MTNISVKSKEALTLAACAAVMIITRGKHFGIGFNFPDATLAIFFIAGIYLRQIAYPVLLMASATLIDYFAVGNGASGSCITPAYLFLIPTYLTMWFGGKTFSSLDLASIGQGLAFGAELFVCSALAFTVSSGGYYLFSGNFAEPTAAEFIQRIIRYSPNYIGNIFIYMALAVFTFKGINAASRYKTANVTAP